MDSANKMLADTLVEVSKLKKEHLVEIKSLGSPPPAVRITLTALVILCFNFIKSQGGDIIITLKDMKDLSVRKEENYFETAKKYLLNDPN